MARAHSADDRFLKIVLLGQPSRTKQKAGRPRLGWRMSKKRFRGNGNFMGGCKEGGFE